MSLTVQINLGMECNMDMFDIGSDSCVSCDWLLKCMV